MFPQSGGTLPVLPENINEFDIPEEKYDILTQSEISTKKGIKRQLEEEEEEYYSAVYTQLNTVYSGCQLNFQYSFGDGGGGQDWSVSILSKTFV